MKKSGKTKHQEPESYFPEEARKTFEAGEEQILYEEALKKAKEFKPNLDCCTEYENGYVFGSYSDDLYVGGIGHTPCVVLKVGGRIISMPEFVIMGTGKEIKSFDL